jgi:hypothetical protein
MARPKTELGLSADEQVKVFARSRGGAGPQITTKLQSL